MCRYTAVLLLTVSMAAMAAPFEYAGLSRATTLQDIAKRYPNSTVSGGYVTVSPRDTHDHIFGIELFGPQLSYRLRINFGSPDQKYPLCDLPESTITSKYGQPSESLEFYEEATPSRRLIWQLESDTVELQCFKDSRNDKYSAEAITVVPVK